MFATIFFGILDPHTRVMTYINAGHLPPIVINKNGLKQTLERTGPAVGGILDANYMIRQVQLEQGDLFFAYTDGLTDAINSFGEYYSQTDLISILCGSQKLSGLITKIHSSIKNFAAGEKQQDDITLLAVRCKNK